MAIARDATSSINSGAWVSGSTISWTHTCASGATLLIAGIFPGGTSDQVTAATYNGVAMTRIGIYSYNGNTINTEYVELYYLVNPAAGSHTVSFTYSASQPNAAGGAVSYTGTATDSSVIDSSAGATDVSTTISPSTTVVKSNCWMVGVVRMSAAALSGVTGGTNLGGYNNGGVCIFDSNGTVGTGAQSPITITDAASGSNCAVIASIAIATTAYTRSLSDSVSYGASRTVSLGRIYNALRSLADSIQNAASRTATLTKGLTRSLSASISNAASRLVSLGRLSTYARAVSDAVMNGVVTSFSSGPNSPGTTVDDATVGTVAWTNPNNAQASDGVYATVAGIACQVSTITTHYLKATNFGFSIPANAIINGILVEVQRGDAGGSTCP